MGPDDFRQEAESELGPDANPYAAPSSGSPPALDPATFPTPSSSPVLPHPNIGWAILWVFGFWSFQLLISVAALAVLLGLAVAEGPASPEQMARSVEESTSTMIPLGTFCSVVFAAGLAWIFYRARFAGCLALRGMSPIQWASSVLIVLPMSILASEVTNCAGEVMPQFNGEVFAGFADGSLLVVLLAGCLFPAVGEEILCRGFLGRGLVAHHGVVPGVFLASLLFGILHVDPVQSTGAFALGVGLHFVYLTTRSLYAPMLIHLLNNASAFMLIRNYQTLPLPGLTPLPDGTMVHTPPLILLLAGLAVVCLGWMLIQSRTRWLLPDGSDWDPGYPTAEAPPLALQARAESSLPRIALLLAASVIYAALLWSLFSAYQSVI